MKNQRLLPEDWHAKGKLIIAGIVLTLSPALYAADTAEIIPAQEVVQAKGTPPLSDVSPMQDHVVEMIEKISTSRASTVSW